MRFEGINSWRRLCAMGIVAAAMGLASSARAGVIFTDGFGDGDRDNNGLDAGATATDPSDVGIPWYLTDGTSSVTFAATDDSAGIGTGNAVQLFNSGSNNRPAVGHFAPVTLNDGDQLVLNFDLRLASVTNASTGLATTADRAIRFGLYHDTNGDDTLSDHSSTGSVSVDDVGYNCRVDAGADTSNSTTLDVTRDDSATGTSIIQATTTSLGISSTDTANQLADANKHHFTLSLTRNGGSLDISLQEDSNTPITGTDATPDTFTFDEAAIGVRSNAAMDTRWDNFNLTLNPAVPEPASLGLVAAAGAMLLRRRRKA